MDVDDELELQAFLREMTASTEVSSSRLSFDREIKKLPPPIVDKSF